MRVLVVEDQPKNVQHSCVAGSAGGRRRRRCGRGRPVGTPSGRREAAYDAIVLDVMLPGLDGFEVLPPAAGDAERWTPSSC